MQIGEFDKFITTKNNKYQVYSGCPEFGYELIAVLPYAYYLYQNNLLSATVSGYDTKPLYFFSPNHTQVDTKRSWDNVVVLQNSNFPNSKIHVSKLDRRQFSPPPFKKFYRNSAILFTKPTVVICNRYNREWSGDPINFLSPDCLRQLFELLSNNYQIVYIDTAYFNSNYADHADFITNPCETIVKEFTGRILTLSELMQKYSDLSINELQCRLYAGCERFISSNGGLGIFCSYFGGENIIFSKTCHELDPEINSFYNWYGVLSGCLIKVVSNEQLLINTVVSKWIRNDPLLNIVIKYDADQFSQYLQIKSILSQDYLNHNIILDLTNLSNLQSIKQPFPASSAWTNLDIKLLTSNGIRLPLKPNQVIENNVLNTIAGYLKNGMSYDYCQNIWFPNVIRLDSNRIVSDYKSVIIIIKCNQMFAYLEDCLSSICSQINPNLSIKVVVAINDPRVGRYKSLTRKYIDSAEFYYTSQLVDDDTLIEAAIKKIISYDSLIIILPVNVLLPPTYLSAINQVKHNLNQHALYSLPTISLESDVRKYINLSEKINLLAEGDILKSLDHCDDEFFSQAFSVLLGSSSCRIKERLAQIVNDKIRFENKSWRISTPLHYNAELRCLVGSYYAFKKWETLKFKSIDQLDVLPLLCWNISTPVNVSEQSVRNISLYKLQ